MTQTTTQVGRAKLNHPDLAFDTDDGGTALHNALAAMWTSVSNHLPTRWTGSVTLVSGNSVAVTHNFNLALSKLKLIFFESGVQLTEDEVTASYAITQTSVNAISIQNITVGSKTFDALILAYQFNITSSDVNPGDPILAQSNWDLTNGTEWNKSLYVNDNFTVSSPLERENVIILGNLTLNANLVVRGRLIVVGNVTGNGYKFDCDGDVTIIGDVSITGIAAPTMIIGGDLMNATTNVNGFVFRGNSDTNGTLTCRRDVIIINPSTMAIGSLTASGLSNAAGNNVIIYGNAKCSIDTSANGQVSSLGLNGGYIKIGGSIDTGAASSALKTDGSAGSSSFASGSAGLISITGNVIASSGTISAIGGASTSATAGNGGSLTVRGNIITGGNVNLSGGSASTTGTGGDAGSFVCYGNAFILGDLITHGGNTIANVAFPAGAAGSITCNGDLKVSGVISSDGGDGGNATKAGGNWTLKNLQIGGSCSSSGGANNGGAGATIVISGWAKCSSSSVSVALIAAIGGTINDGSRSAGAGGSVTIWGECSQVGINVSGGDATLGVNAGNGGTIIVYGIITGDSNPVYYAKGGVCSGACTGTVGAGGTITINGCTSYQADFKTDGAPNATAADGSNGGAGGALVCNGDLKCYGISLVGGGVTKTGATAAGGVGGNLTVKGNLVVSGSNLDVSGGSVTSTSGGAGGNSGSITIRGDAIFENPSALIASGGDSAGGNGGHSTAGILIVGNLICKKTSGTGFTVRGGDSTKTSGSATGGSLGTVEIGNNWITKLANIIVRGGNATNAGLTTGIGGVSRSNPPADAPLVTIGGNAHFGESGAYYNSVTFTCYFNGGSGKTTAGHGPGIRCDGYFRCYGVLDISGGNCTDGAGNVGSYSNFWLFGGGQIATVKAVNTAGASQGNNYNGAFRYGGITNIGYWQIPDTYYWYTSSYQMVNLSSSSDFMGAMVTVGRKSNNAIGFRDATNYLPTGCAGLSGGSSKPVYGICQANGYDTEWRYKTFDNA